LKIIKEKEEKEEEEKPSVLRKSINSSIKYGTPKELWGRYFKGVPNIG